MLVKQLADKVNAVGDTPADRLAAVVRTRSVPVVDG
jgi:hypothetical protein